MTAPDEAFDRVQRGVRSFMEATRAQGIHVGVGVGDKAVCVTCGEGWPCSSSQPQCEARILLMDDRWGGFTDQCEGGRGHGGDHFVVMGATMPLGRLVWPQEADAEPVS